MSNIKTVRARNLVSGQVGDVPATYLTHPHFGKQLELVSEDAKPLVPELHTPRDSDGDKLNDAAVKVEKPKAPTKPAQDAENR